MNDVIAEARDWLGLPYHHQARVKGVDCAVLQRKSLHPVRGLGFGSTVTV